ncbi:MAG: nucleotide sugar dehydrogenase, partial [Actinobacteria bacterium]|nr:nucleotide sugar dehydrogenase [Actinomycetota bacterium]
AEVRAADPHVTGDSEVDPRIVRVPAAEAEAAAADVVVLLTEHDDFDVGALAAAAHYLFDTRNVVPDGPNVERL